MRNLQRIKKATIRQTDPQQNTTTGYYKQPMKPLFVPCYSPCHKGYELSRALEAVQAPNTLWHLPLPNIQMNQGRHGVCAAKEYNRRSGEGNPRCLQSPSAFHLCGGPQDMLRIADSQTSALWPGEQEALWKLKVQKNVFVYVQSKA